MDAANNWTHERHRHQFARLLDHGPIYKSCEGLKSRLKERLGKKPSEEEKETAAKLQNVADAFIQLQNQRHSADYDNSREWTRIETLNVIVQSETAATNWMEIRKTELAQDFLFDLMPVPRARVVPTR